VGNGLPLHNRAAGLSTGSEAKYRTYDGGATRAPNASTLDADV